MADDSWPRSYPPIPPPPGSLLDALGQLAEALRGLQAAQVRAEQANDKVREYTRLRQVVKEDACTRLRETKALSPSVAEKQWHTDEEAADWLLREELASRLADQANNSLRYQERLVDRAQALLLAEARSPIIPADALAFLADRVIAGVKEVVSPRPDFSAHPLCGIRWEAPDGVHAEPTSMHYCIQFAGHRQPHSCGCGVTLHEGREDPLS